METLKIITNTGVEVELNEDGTFEIPSKKIKDRFAPEIASEKGLKVIRTFAYFGGKRILLSVENTKELVEFLNKVNKKLKEEEEKAREDEKHRIKLNIGVCFNSDYSCHYVYFDDRLSEEEILKKILEEGRKELSCCHREETHEKSILSAYKEWKEKRNKAEEEKLKRQEHEKRCFEQAKEQAKPVLIKEYYTDCDDPNEECSADFVRVYAMPDGTKKIERTHTY